MLELTIEETGFKDMIVGFDRLIAGVKDFRPVWDEVQQEFYRIEERAFTSQGSSQGKKWRALSPGYAKWKARKYPGRTILEREGDLRLSLTGKGDATRVKTATMYMEKSRVPYAIFHQAPTPFRRTPVQLTQKDRAAIGMIFARYVRRLIGKSFKKVAA